MMMMTPRYKHQSIVDLEWMVITPMLLNQIAVATGKANMQEGGEAPNVDTLAGVAIWAKVSNEVDKKIREQITAKVFPIRLQAKDWRSGDKVWLLDVIAPTKALATKLFSELGRSGLGNGDIHAHPIVNEVVDMETLKKLGAKAKTADASSKTVN